MIASKINDSAYISHRSAFEYYGYADQVQNDVYVSSNSAFRKFEFDGFNYIFIKSRIDDGVIMKSDKVVKSDKVIESDGVVGSGGIVATGRVRVTDIEHTVIDCINDFEKFGGPEALLNSIPSLPLLDEEKLLLYLKCYNKQVLYQKTGYMLEHFKNELKISGEFFISCKKGILKSVHRLSMNIHKSESVYDKKWRLYVPEKLMSLLAEGAEFGDKYNDPIHPVWE
jgi:predicted transcriptional regulator of viral defense system